MTMTRCSGQRAIITDDSEPALWRIGLFSKIFADPWARLPMGGLRQRDYGDEQSSKGGAVADLSVSYEYLDSLASTLGQIAGQAGLDDVSASVDHSVTGSAAVESAGDEILKFQTSVSSAVAANVETLAASVADASTTMAEADAALSSGASSGGSDRGGRGGGGSF
jgi:hypothetical protein